MPVKEPSSSQMGGHGDRDHDTAYVSLLGALLSSGCSVPQSLTRPASQPMSSAAERRGQRSLPVVR